MRKKTILDGVVFILFLCFVFVFYRYALSYNDTYVRCIMKTMTFTAFHYLNLSIRCEELDTHIVMSQRHPFSTVSCFRRFPSRDKISHYFDRFICQRLYYDAEIAWMINPHCILSQIYALFIGFYYALFLFFIDMHYNTMIRTLDV
jgi:hypothetical protein